MAIPSGSSLQALPVAPSINPMQGVAANDPLGNMAAGIDFAGQFARLGQLRSKIELEDAQRKAEMAKSKASLLEADLIQRDLEDKFNIEKAQRQLALESAALAQRQALALAPIAVGTAGQNLANVRTQGALAGVSLGEAQDTAEFNKEMRGAARSQLANLDVVTGAPVAVASTPSGPVAVPFIPNAKLEQWIKPQVAAKILETRRPVMSVSALAKELGVKPEKRGFVDANTGAEYETDVLTGPAGEIFKVSEPRFVKASAMQAAVDKQFADDVADFVSGGAVKAQANINKLDGAIKILNQAGTIAASGPVVGLIPEKVRKPFTTDKTLGVQKDIEQVVQESLKAILGAQFAQKEAEQLLSRSFDTSLSEEANAIRVGALKVQLQNALDARTAAVDYFQKHGTLAGSKYKAPTATGAPSAGTDLTSNIPVDVAVPTVSTRAGPEIRVDPATGKLYQRINGVVTEIGR